MERTELAVVTVCAVTGAVAIFAVPALILGTGLYATRAGLDFQTVKLLMICVTAFIGAIAIGIGVVLARWERRNGINLNL